MVIKLIKDGPNKVFYVYKKKRKKQSNIPISKKTVYFSFFTFALKVS